MNLQAEILKLQHRVQALESKHRKQGLQTRDMQEGQELAANQQRQRSATLEIVAGNTDGGQTNNLTEAPRGLHTSRGSLENLSPTDQVQVFGEHQSQESSLTATVNSQVMSIPQTTQQTHPEHSDISLQEENKKLLEQIEKLKEKNLKLKKLVKRMKEDATTVDWKEAHDALLAKARRLQSIIYKELSRAQKERIWEFMASNRSTSTYIPVGQEGM